MNEQYYSNNIAVRLGIFPAIVLSDCLEKINRKTFLLASSKVSELVKDYYFCGIDDESRIDFIYSTFIELKKHGYLDHLWCDDDDGNLNRVIFWQTEGQMNNYIRDTERHAEVR